ncbi:MAG: hypothetical protein KGI32_08775, partial [Gammaproteobacteria bacterium]|nr:hypothetical protein [Gammaproteobacteria bacterium]
MPKLDKEWEFVNLIIVKDEHRLPHHFWIFLMTPVSPLPRRSPTHQRWTLDDIPWQSLDRSLIADQELLFYLLTTAAFIETAT